MRRPWKTSVYWFRQRSRVVATDLLSGNRRGGGGGGDPLFCDSARTFDAADDVRPQTDAATPSCLAWFRDAFYYAPTRAPYICRTTFIHIGSSKNAETYLYLYYIYFILGFHARVYEHVQKGGDGLGLNCSTLRRFPPPLKNSCCR